MLHILYEKEQMKKLLLFLILPLFAIGQANKSVVAESEWLTDYETALSKANDSNNNLLVYFTGSDWCPPCKMLKKDLFESEAFQALSEDYVLLYIDIPMNKDLISADQLKHNKELAARLNKKGSVPVIKILNPKGKELDKYSGYSMNGETQYHLKLLKKHQ